MESKATPISISVATAILMGLHIAFPSLGIDGITIGLLIVAILPWLVPYIKSVELPGGTKIELRELKAAADKIITAEKPVEFAEADAEVVELVTDIEAENTFDILRAVARRDPNLAMVGFRIEIEKRLRTIAERHDIPAGRRSLRSIILELRNRGVLPRSVSMGLEELVDLGNRAAHGAQTSHDAAEWVLDSGPSVLYELERIADGRNR